MLNKQILVGRLGNDPEAKTFGDGGMVCNVSVATDNTWRDKKSGEMKSITTWHRVVFRNKLAEIVKNNLSKGSLVYVEGRTDHRKWQDKNGEDKLSVEIVASELRMLGKKDEQQKPKGQPTSNAGKDFPGEDIDVPF
jgi:single-strand DNA-binding protein